MQVALLEICEKNHYMVTHALIRTYSSDPTHSIIVFTLPEIYKLLQEDAHVPGVKFIIKSESESISDFLRKANEFPWARMHYCTISKYYREFLEALPQKGRPLFFHFHNIDIWFKNISGNLSKDVLTKIKKGYTARDVFSQIKWGVKEMLRDPVRKKLIRRIMDLRPEYIALSQVQKKLLGAYIPEENIRIFPSLIFENTDADVAANGDKLKLCIPGSVSDTRRDYSGFFHSVVQHAEFYSRHVQIELLGYLNPGEGHLHALIDNMKRSGVDIMYYNDFLSPETYDKKLAMADVLLGNVTLQLSSGGQGQLKETGTVYNLVRGAKPGLFPKGFVLDAEFEASTRHYSDYNALVGMLKVFRDRPDTLKNLSSAAMELSLQHSPTQLIKRLIP